MQRLLRMLHRKCGRSPYGYRKPDRPFLALDIHAFIQLLRNHHGFLCCHVQVLARLLLHGTCGKGGNGLFLSAACFTSVTAKSLPFKPSRTSFVSASLASSVLFHPCRKISLQSPCHPHPSALRPASSILRDKFADFLSVANQAQRNRLHTTAAQTLLHFFQSRSLIV